MQQVKLRRNLYQQVVNDLGMRIVRGEFRTGDTFPNETELSLSLGVSRTVTREAIKVLSEKGLVAARPKTGTQVRPRSDWNLLDGDILNWEYEVGPKDIFLHRLSEVRLIIEPAASELAAQRATADELAAMEAAYREMVASVETTEAYIAADMRFHAAIVKASHNEMLEQIVGVIRVALIASRKITSHIPGGSQDALPIHFEVLDAIRNRQPEAASQTMRQLVLRARKDIEKIIGHNGHL